MVIIFTQLVIEELCEGMQRIFLVRAQKKSSSMVHGEYLRVIAERKIVATLLIF